MTPPEQRREYIRQMSPEQRKQLMEDAATYDGIKIYKFLLKTRNF